MAITDNSFTPEELTAAVAANPALVPHLVGAVKGAGYVARSADEETSFIGTKTKEIYDGLDKDIFDTSGIARNPTERTYDYAKRVIGKFKEDTTPLQQEIIDLKKTIADGNGNETMKAQLEALQTKEAEYQKQLTEKDTALFQKDVKLDIRDGVRGIKFDPSVKESVVKVLVDNATQSIIGMAKQQQNADGTTSVVYIKDGKTLLNDKNQPADAAYILADMLKDVVDAGHQGQGGGAGGQGTGGAQGGRKPTALPATLPATVKNQGQLMDWLMEYGLTEGSKEYDDAYDKFGTGLPLR
ncbi:hypothetical protein [Hymenobacter rigui]|uniref:Uncharacterized protein n=1 Tax=Hymenobacter rigui TaxID=334424 RepID=A0A428KUA2_9BACT|nr:hypothetical protein [Hymenobacter rigui]RSK50100.1 hypothetical protein EI291_05465 [Hymenobacter rigui]